MRNDNNINVDSHVFLYPRRNFRVITDFNTLSMLTDQLSCALKSLTTSRIIHLDTNRFNWFLVLWILRNTAPQYNMILIKLRTRFTQLGQLLYLIVHSDFTYSMILNKWLTCADLFFIHCLGHIFSFTYVCIYTRHIYAWIGKEGEGWWPNPLLSYNKLALLSLRPFWVNSTTMRPELAPLP